MKNFDMRVETLYQLCRKVQRQGNASISFDLVNFETGGHLTVHVYNGLFDKDSDSKMYSISENGYQEEENFIKAKEHLERILREE